MLVQERAGRGRVAVAAQAHRPGTLVVSEEPFAAVLYAEQIPQRCDFSFAPAKHLLRCSRCKVHRFASKRHQKAAWDAYYKEESTALQR